jgi:hypothetical protein
MNTIVNIFSHSEEHTTARYFFNAIKNSGICVNYYINIKDIKEFGKEDIFFFIDPVSDWPIGLEKLNCISIAYLIDVHQDLELRINQSYFFDKVYVAQKDYLIYFNQNHLNKTKWLPLASAPYLLKNNNDYLRLKNVSFIGNYGPNGSFRNILIKKIINRFPENITDKYTRPKEMMSFYQNSKIVFNISINGDLNMRFFEALLGGALLITNRIQNGLSDLFIEDVHYVGYSTTEEAISKIEYYLANDNKRQTIAKNGNILVKKNHTYDKRWDEIYADIGNILKRDPKFNYYSKKQLLKIYAKIYLALRKPFRIFQISFSYGVTAATILIFFHAVLRKINQYIPITPKALKSKMERFIFK